MLTMRPPLTCTSVAQPTEQKGQILGTDFASRMRSSCACARAGASVAPRPTNPPIAVPAPAPAVTRRKSRRLTCICLLPPPSDYQGEVYRAGRASNFTLTTGTCRVKAVAGPRNWRRLFAARPFLKCGLEVECQDVT